MDVKNISSPFFLFSESFEKYSILFKAKEDDPAKSGINHRNTFSILMIKFLVWRERLSKKERFLKVSLPGRYPKI